MRLQYDREGPTYDARIPSLILGFDLRFCHIIYLYDSANVFSEINTISW